jgi:serine protease Do
MLAVAVSAASAVADEATEQRRTPVVRAVEKCGPTVVNIFTARVTVERDPFFFNLPDVFRQNLPREFFERRMVSRSLGSGVLVHEEGYIVTNAHVVQQSGEIRVVLADKREFQAALVSADLDNDLAIIKISDAKPLPCAQLGTSGDLMIGETVIAIGNPLGYSNTVSAGIISALDRKLEFASGVSYQGLIQTDAAINPGNSGGALVNINGEVIGINVAIRSDAEGLGFAIPVDHVRENLVRLLGFRNFERLRFGAALAEERSKSAAGEWRFTLRVREVEDDSPAARGGLKVGDTLLAVEDHAVASLIDFETVLLKHAAGDEIPLKVRRDKDEKLLKVTFGKAHKPDGVALARARLGLHVGPLTSELIKKFNTAVDFGVIVLGVEGDGPGAAAGFRAGDIIIQANTHRLAGPDDLGLVLAVPAEGAKVVLHVVRGRYAVGVAVPLRGKPEMRR